MEVVLVRVPLQREVERNDGDSETELKNEDTLLEDYHYLSYPTGVPVKHKYDNTVPKESHLVIVQGPTLNRTGY